MFKIPQSDKRFLQDNSSDRKGNISITKNISFDKSGYLQLEKRTRSIENSASMTDFNTTSYGIEKIMDYNGNIYALGTKNIYVTGSTPTVFSLDTSTGTPTLGEYGNNDAAVFDGLIYVCNGASLYSGNGSVWTSRSSQNIESLCLFANLNQLAGSKDNTVILFNTSYAEVIRLTLPQQYIIQKMAWANSKLYIATRDDEYGGAMMFEWNGLTTDAQVGKRIEAQTIFSVAPYKDGVVCVTSDWEILYYNGGFQLLDRFPNFFKNLRTGESGSSTLYNRVPKNALAVRGDKVYVGIDNKFQQFDMNGPRFYQDSPSGVWCYDPAVGLHHKFSIDNSLALRTNVITTANVNTTTNIITIAGQVVPSTGTPVFYFVSEYGLTDTSSATPLKSGTKYYTIYVSDTTLKLATSYDNAIANTAIDITGTGNNAQFLYFAPSGQMGGIVNYVQCIECMDKFNNQYMHSQLGGRFFIGGMVNTTTAEYRSTISVVSSGQENRGYVITPKLDSTELTDNYNSISLKFKPLITVDDKIIIKYRKEDDTLMNYETSNFIDEKSTVWVDGNTYTTTVDISAVKTRADLGVLDEIEITSGEGCGYLAHITSITEDAGTYTVNIDETVPDVVAGHTLRVVYSNWIKVIELNSTSPEGIVGLYSKKLDKASKWIQIKLEFRGEDITLEELIVNNQTQLPVL